MTTTTATTKNHNLADGEVFDIIHADTVVEVIAEQEQGHSGKPVKNEFALISTATGQRVQMVRPNTKITVVDGSRD